MNRQAWKLLGCLGLAVCVVAAGKARTADDDEDDIKAAKAAQADIIQVMEGKLKPDEVKKKYPELKPLMWSFKPSAKGGIGAGPRGGADSIEQKIIILSKGRRDDPAVLEKIAQVSKAMADIADQYPPKKAADVPKWKKYNDEMRQGAEELAKAAKAKDNAAIKKAAGALNDSCKGCHGDFRDN